MPLRLGPLAAPSVLLFAPGDGGRAEDPLPSQLGAALAPHGVQTLSLDAPPALGQSLDEGWRQTIRQAAARLLPEQRLILAGFSRGARVSAALVPELGARALLGFGYPFHAPDQDRDLERVEQLASCPCPALIIQGARDPHGNRDQVRGYALPSSIQLHYIEGAKHLLPAALLESPPGASALDAAVDFVRAQA